MVPPTTAFASAFIAAMIGFGGTVALVVQASQAMGATTGQTISTVTALCLGIGLAGGILSLVMRMPIVLAWSTPGAALLGASALHLDWATAIGAFIAASTLMIVLGLVPALGRLAARIPPAVASAMLAGVLLPFCLALFQTLGSDLLFAGIILVSYVLARQWLPLYAMLTVLAVAFMLVLLRGDIAQMNAPQLFGALEPTMPRFDLQSMASIGIPLFLVTLASQNLPGLVVLRTSGYEAPPGPILSVTGLATLGFAPFGAFGVNLAAITAALCTSPEAHPDKSRRWQVGIIYAAIYLLLALFSAPLVALFLAMPATTIAAIAGVALISPFGNALHSMLQATEHREAAILTFAATASGVSLWGIGSAFWGLLIGFSILALRQVHLRTRRSEPH
ncbi:benzoate/H(+) symporter BenE family transporter [Devosia pacifica]|nr:benzoate/H(+) symporter BenE family transporter [Devosia pacifica]